MIRIALALLLASAPLSAAADDASQTPPTAPSDRTQQTIAVQAWGKANGACAEWSDGCVVCTQDGCSTPGVACTPRETQCRRSDREPSGSQ